MNTLFYNGRIFTSDEARPYAQAMLAENGIIKWIGSAQEANSAKAESRAGDAIEEIDLRGRTVIPGFVDAHMHPMMLAEYSKQIACLPPKINSIEELVREISSAAEKAEDGEWIRGWGYDEGKYTEKRMPDRYDLDRGSKGHPVFLVRSCEHIRCVNSKALEIAGITKDTQDPPGGHIDRDENGEPTGVLRESARDLVLPYMPEETEEEMAEALVDLGKLLSSQGIVGIGDMGNLHPGGNYEIFEKAVAGGFRQRASLYYMWDYFMDDPDFHITKQQMDPHAHIRIAGIKMIGDGSISGRTAWVKEPYLGTDETGFPVYSDEEMDKALQFCRAHECQLAVHAMGGRAIDRVVDRAFRQPSWMEGDTPALRVEHVTEPSEEAVAKAVERGFAFVSQPIFEYCEIETYCRYMDAERLKHIYPFRTLLDRGVHLSLSTDAPATSWAVPSDPFTNLKSAVTRRAYEGTDIGQDQRLDIETAVRLYTKNAAEVCGLTGLGQLAPGYAADFAVLSEDIFTIDADRIDQVQVDETWIDGERIWAREI